MCCLGCLVMESNQTVLPGSETKKQVSVTLIECKQIIYALCCHNLIGSNVRIFTFSHVLLFVHPNMQTGRGFSCLQLKQTQAYFAM